MSDNPFAAAVSQRKLQTEQQRLQKEINQKKYERLKGLHSNLDAGFAAISSVLSRIDTGGDLRDAANELTSALPIFFQCMHELEYLDIIANWANSNETNDLDLCMKTPVDGSHLHEAMLTWNIRCAMVAWLSLGKNIMRRRNAQSKCASLRWWNKILNDEEPGEPCRTYWSHDRIPRCIQSLEESIYGIRVPNSGESGAGDSSPSSKPVAAPGPEESDISLLRPRIVLLATEGIAATLLSASDLARVLEQPTRRVETFLRRLRDKLPDCAVILREDRENKPSYLYEVDMIWPILEEKLAVWRQSPPSEDASSTDAE